MNKGSALRSWHLFAADAKERRLYCLSKPLRMPVYAADIAYMSARVITFVIHTVSVCFL